MKYDINEIFYSLQGEGKFTGTAAMFIRLSGCNLKCLFCDTDHTPQMFLSEDEILQHIDNLSSKCKFVVLTGGEPLLQDLVPLINLLHKHKYFIAIESNGIIGLPAEIEIKDIHHIVSPKEGSELAKNLLCVNEMKFIVTDTFTVEYAKQCISKAHVINVYLQPESERPDMIEKAIKIIKEEEPQWKLSIQTQKILNIL